MRTEQKKIDRMKTVISLAEQDLEQAGQTLHAIQTQLEQTQFQVDSLTQYLHELSSQNTHSSGTLSASHFQNTHAFIHKVQVALGQEQQKVLQLQEVVERAREDWMEKRAYLKGLQKVQKNLELNQEKRAQRQEQNMLDDLASASMLEKK